MGQDSGEIHGAVGKGLAPPDFGFDDKKPIDGLALYRMNRSEPDSNAVMLEQSLRWLGRRPVMVGGAGGDKLQVGRCGIC